MNTITGSHVNLLKVKTTILVLPLTLPSFFSGHQKLCFANNMSQIQRAQLPGCVGIQMTLASYYSKMKDLTKAEEYLNNALKLDPKNTEVLLLQAKVRKEKQLEQQTKKMKEKLVLPKHGKLKMKDSVKVQCNSITMYSI